MIAYRAYGALKPGQTGMLRVMGGPRRVLSWARGLHYPQPFKAPDGPRCRDCLARLQPYNARGKQSFRHRVEKGLAR